MFDVLARAIGWGFIVIMKMFDKKAFTKTDPTTGQEIPMSTQESYDSVFNPKD